MRVIGIDLGFVTTGFSIVEKREGKIFLLDFGLLSMSSSQSVSYRIGCFYDFFDQKLIEGQIQVISLETPFLGKNVQSFLKLGYLRGLLYLLANKHNLDIVEFSPREVKLSITGFGGAEKDQIARVLMRLFPGLQMPKKLDLTDAMAVSLCGLWNSSFKK